jgi:hypothetical protein
MSDEEIWQQWERDDQDSIVEYRLNFSESLYNDTQNALCAWEAIRVLKESCKEYPDWVKNYLSNVAENILGISEPGKEAAALIKRALGLHSAKAFADFHYSWQKDQGYDRGIQERKRRKHGEKGSIYADVGKEFNVSEDTIKKWFLEVKKWRDNIVSDT